MIPLVLAVASATLFLLAIAGWRMSRSTGLEEVEDQLALPARGAAAPARPGPLVRASDFLGVRFQRNLLALYGPRRLAELDRRLDRAGRPEGLSARGFVQRQAGMSAIGGFAGGILLLSGQPLIAALMVAGFALMLPLWLRGVANRRQAVISRELPDFLDVLAVTVSAGLSLQSAMERVVEADDRPLSTEIRRVLEDLRLGVPRRAALTALRTRNDSPAIGSWVTAMLHAEELGSPLAGALGDIASDIRREASQQARRDAAKTSPKVSLIVTLVILPGALLLIMASLLLANSDILGVLG
ncbi:MAG: type II secretion system F family protein [Propionicimonas sp.]|nr:type II secretion system F family protein [Propionicimonas sp.]